MYRLCIFSILSPLFAFTKHLIVCIYDLYSWRINYILFINIKVCSSYYILYVYYGWFIIKKSYVYIIGKVLARIFLTFLSQFEILYIKFFFVKSFQQLRSCPIFNINFHFI